MRRLVKAAAWMAKGALALIALVAVIAWPLSYAHPGRVQAMRWTAAHELQVDALALRAGWDRGRIWMGWGAETFTDCDLSYGRREMRAAGPGWAWAPQRAGADWADSARVRSWGPVRGLSEEFVEGGRFARWHAVALPCYALAVAAGAWPLVGVARTLRRRAARRVAAHCCRRCGYDLRATPSAAGPVLPTCPECGVPATPA